MTIFGTDGIRGTPGKSPLTAEEILKIGRAFSCFLGKNPRILVGRDPRKTGFMMQSAAMAGITSAGGEVYDAGMMPTPAAAYVANSMKMDGAIVISASHNPADENGLKFFIGKGTKLPVKAEEEIEKIFREDRKGEEPIGRIHSFHGSESRYLDFVKQKFLLKVEGIKAVIDCANGAASEIAPQILEELGVELEKINCEPDGTNINQECGSEHPEKMAEAVLKEKAQIGIALDGDADRVMISDEKGNLLTGDQLIGMAAIHMARSGRLQSQSIVATHYSNYGLESSLSKYGIKVARSDVGDRAVAAEMEKRKTNLGGEQSGHIIFGDMMPTGDGLLTAMHIMEIIKKEGKPLSELASAISKLPQKMINVEVREKKPIESLQLSQKIREAEKVLEGAGRVLVRYSGTQSLLRIMVEGKNEKQINSIAQELAKEAKKEIGK